MKERTKHSKAKLVLFSIIPLLTLLAALETCARLLPPVEYNPEAAGFMGGGSELFIEDPLLMWRALPGMKGRHATNRGGFRDDGFAPGSPGALRILLLGDSTTWGWGVAREDMYAGALERTLEASSQEAEIDVINGGMPGYSAYQGLLLLRTELGRYGPDVVITYFGINDSHAGPGLTPDMEIRRAPAAIAGVARLLRRSRFYNYARLTITRARGAKASGHAAADEIRMRLTPDDFRIAMDGIAAECEEAGATLVSMDPLWFFNGEMRNDVSKIIFSDKGTVVEYAGEPVYRYDPASWDTMGALRRNAAAEPGALFLDYCHFSPLAHRIAGEALALDLLKIINGKD